MNFTKYGLKDRSTGPLVSIVIPCFNASKTLERTIKSIIQQNYLNFEVIMVDDGSTDTTSEIIRYYEDKDYRFRSFKQENSGVSAARNKGVSIANAEYIAFLDADDLFYKNSITNRMKAILENDSADLLGAYCPAVMIFDDGKSMGLPTLFNYHHLPNNRLYFSFTLGSIFNPSCVIVKKNKFVQAGGFNETIAPAEDYLLWHQMMRSGGYFILETSCKIGYTQHPSSAVRSTLLKHYNQAKRVIELLFLEDQNSIPECRSGFGQSLFYRGLSNRAFSTAVMAIAKKEFEVANKVSFDISKYDIDMTDPTILESQIRFNALRALCMHKKNWDSVVWPEIKEDIINFITELNSRFGGSCHSLLELKGRLVKGKRGIKQLNKYRYSVATLLMRGRIWLSHSMRNKLIFLLLLFGYTFFIVVVVMFLILVFYRHI